jgi:peptidoglycan/LPS O-acetylase OafA/YrhL
MSIITRPAPPERVEWLDFLRGVSAFAVVLFHVRVPLWAGWRAVMAGDTSSTLDRALAWLSLPIPLFGSAVMLFFIVSGFAIHYPYAGSPGPLRLGEYAVRRFFRIYPAYAAAVLITAAAERVAAGTSDLTPSSAGKIIASLLMVQHYVAPAGQMAGNPSLWSLPVEVELYLTYPLVWWVGRRAGTRGILGLAAVGSALAAGALLAGHAWPMGNFAKYWLIWVSGAVLAEQVRTRKLPSWRPWHRLALIGALAAAVAGRVAGVPVGLEHFIWGGFYFLAVLWGLNHPAPLRRLGTRVTAAVHSIGRISYSLYLVHFPLFIALGAWWLAVFGEKPASVIIPLLASVAAVPAAYLLWRFVERPAHTYGRALGDSKTPRLAVANAPIGALDPIR